MSAGSVHLKKSAYTSNTVFTFLLKKCSHNRQEMLKCYLLICKPWPFIHQDSRRRFTKLKQVEHLCQGKISSFREVSWATPDMYRASSHWRLSFYTKCIDVECKPWFLSLQASRLQVSILINNNNYYYNIYYYYEDLKR